MPLPYFSLFKKKPRHPVASGTVTQANMRISGVNGGETASGGAFIDFGAADVLTGKLGHLLVVKDSAGRAIQGYVKAAGSAEGLGDELVNGWTNNAIHPYETFTPGAGNTITQAINTTAYGIASSDIGTTLSGMLTKLVAGVTITSGKISNIFSGSTTIGGTSVTLASNITSSQTITTYVTELSGQRYLIVFNENANAGNFGSTFTYQQVLAPSATGVTIVSTKGGVTYNWATKNASFNYNDALGYTYQIYKVLDTPVVASGSITAGNALMDTTVANAFAAPVGVDLSAYQDGNHVIGFYNTGGASLIARISDTAPGGLDTTEINGDVGFDNSGYWTSIGTGWTVNNAGNSKAVATTATGNLDKTTAHAFTNKLYYVSFTIDSITGGQVYYQIGGQSGPGQIAAGTFTEYRTSPGITNDIRLRCIGSTSAVCDNFSVLNVTMPAATGVLLESSAGVRGYISKSATFDPNLAMTYKVFYLGS
jgi:hypothetical protein